MFTAITKLQGHVPQAIYDQLLTINEIDGPKRCSHFLGQCKTESNFTTFTENLNYSAEGLYKTFKKYFPTLIVAAEYARQPEKIANRVYANRMGNDDEQSGDGWRYRGRGAIQLTGKDNYTAFMKYSGIDVVAKPELVTTTYQMASAAWFFTTKGLWSVCDKGVTDEVITEASKRVNGGTNHLDTRLSSTKYFYQLLSS